MPLMTPIAVGYGAGDANPEGWPNVLRVFLSPEGARDGRARDTVVQIETNLDDVNPQTYEHIMERLFRAGALDVTLTPVIMKRGRPAIVLACLVAARRRRSGTECVVRRNDGPGYPGSGDQPAHSSTAVRVSEDPRRNRQDQDCGRRLREHEGRAGVSRL